MNASTNDTLKLPEPDTELRSDLWPTMTVPLLTLQREICIDKLARLQNMVGIGLGTQTVRSIYISLECALNDLNYLIDTRSSKQR